MAWKENNKSAILQNGNMHVVVLLQCRDRLRINDAAVKNRIIPMRNH